MRADGRPSGVAVRASSPAAAPTPARPRATTPAGRIVLPRSRSSTTSMTSATAPRSSAPRAGSAGGPGSLRACCCARSSSTEIPTVAREILERERRAVARPLIVHAPVVAAEEHGWTITDVDGNTFLDCAGGSVVRNVGHNHPGAVKAIHEQADRFLHTDYTVVAYEAYIEPGEAARRARPGLRRHARRVLQPRDVEAVENAVKLARLTGRQAVIAFEGAFHGRIAAADHDLAHLRQEGPGPPRRRSTARRLCPHRGPDVETALTASSGCCRRIGLPTTSRRSCSSRAAGRGRVRPRGPGVRTRVYDQWSGSTIGTRADRAGHRRHAAPDGERVRGDRERRCHPAGAPHREDRRQEGAHGESRGSSPATPPTG